MKVIHPIYHQMINYIFQLKNQTQIKTVYLKIKIYKLKNYQIIIKNPRIFQVEKRLGNTNSNILSI
jgi:hypothetical protein